MKNTIIVFFISIFFFLCCASYADNNALRNRLASQESAGRLNVTVLLVAPGNIENEEEIIRRVREAILIDNTAFAVEAVVLVLGKRGIGFDKKLIKAIDNAFWDKYNPHGVVLGDFEGHKRVMRKFFAKAIKKAQDKDDRDFLYALLKIYQELNEINGWDSWYQVKTVKNILVILEQLLRNGDVRQKQDIVDRFMPFIIEIFPKVVLYWETYPYNKELINLFSTFAPLYPEHPLLIKACRKFVGLEECIRKEMYSRARWALPRKIVHALTAGRTGGPVPAQQLIRFRATPDSGIVGVTPDTIAISRMINDIDDEAKRRAMEKEIKIFTKTWSDFISSLISSFGFLRDVALRFDSDFYHHEWLEGPDVHVLSLAQESNLIKEKGERVFIRTPFGIDIPLKKEERRTLLRRSGESFISPYSFDYESVEEVFRERLFFGLKIGGPRKIGEPHNISNIRVSAFMYAMVWPEVVLSMQEVGKRRVALIESAVRFESIDTGLSEERIKETYDMAELVKKWLDKLGIMNIDIQTQGPFSSLQMLPPASPVIQHAL